MGEESFDLPHQSANDVSRHDVIKDITRIEAALTDGHADSGCTAPGFVEASGVGSSHRLRLGLSAVGGFVFGRRDVPDR